MRRVWQDKWFLGFVGLALAVVFGSLYVHYEVDDADKPTWVAVATDAVLDALGELHDFRTISSMPDCGDGETVRKVEDMARELVFKAMPYNIEQPFHLDKIELVAVTEREMGGEGRACRGHVRAPDLSRPGQQYRVGVIGWTILEDETRAGWYVVEAQLESVNLRRWVD